MEPFPSKLGCVQSHEQPLRTGSPAGRRPPTLTPLSHVVPLLDGTAQRSKTSRCVLTSGPLRRLRSHCAVAVLSPEPSAYDPPPKEALPHFVLPGLGPSTKPLLFFLEPASGFPETQTKRSACGTPQKHGTLLVPLSGIQALQLPPPLAGAASPPHSLPQPPSCPFQPLGSQETGLLCSDSGSAFWHCAKLPSCHSGGLLIPSSP